MERKCPECNLPIRGRSDKKFCSDACRNAFNNKVKTDATNFVRNVNNVLRKNRRILEELLPGETAKTTKTTLNQKGFDFGYFTNTYTTKKGATYYYCYEYGYLPLDNDFYFLVKKREYNEQ